jgi:hypothetical protein
MKFSLPHPFNLSSLSFSINTGYLELISFYHLAKEIGWSRDTL